MYINVYIYICIFLYIDIYTCIAGFSLIFKEEQHENVIFFKNLLTSCSQSDVEVSIPFSILEARALRGQAV